MPPLAADGHRRDPAWRDGLAMLLDDFDGTADAGAGAGSHGEPARARAERGGSLADGFLHGARGRRRRGRRALCGGGAAGLFHPPRRGFARAILAAAAAARAVPLLRLDAGLGRGDRVGPDAGHALSVLLAVRHRVESCARRVHHLRRVARRWLCEGIEGDSGAVKAETCDECHTYAKMLYQAQDMKVDPFADDLATLGLDLLVAEAGWARHAPNPLLLIG